MIRHVPVQIHPLVKPLLLLYLGVFQIISMKTEIRGFHCRNYLLLNPLVTLPDHLLMCRLSRTTDQR